MTLSRLCVPAAGSPSVAASGDATSSPTTLRLRLTELATNVNLHAGTDCLIQAAYAQPTLSVAVSDADGSEIRQGAVPDSAEDGRGLAIVAALADAWGTRRYGGSKRVWFVLSVTNGTG